MSRATRALIQIGLALLLSLGAAFLVFQWMASRPVVQPVSNAPGIPTIVAAKDIKAGALLLPSMLKTTQLQAAKLPPRSFRSASQLKGRVLAKKITAGEPITEIVLVPKEGLGVSAMIAPGKRAMAVKGNAVMGLAGFVRPGDRVDVLVSFTIGQQEHPVTKLVLEKILVLATGTQLTAEVKGGKTAPVDVYTLELSPKQSELLALAATQGTLHFALRNGDDSQPVLTGGANVKSLLTALKASKKKRAGKKVYRPSKSIEVITGGERTRQKVK